MLTEPSDDTLVLRKSTKEQQQLKMLLFFLPILFFLAIYMMLMDDWTTRWPKIQANPTPFLLLMGLVLMVVFVLPSLILFYRYQAVKRERLVLDADGIRYQSNLPQLLQGLLPMTYRDWSAQWANITATYLKPATIPFGRGHQFITIEFHMGWRSQETFPCQWVTDSVAEELFKLPTEQQWQSPTPEQVKTALQGYPVIRYLSDKGLQIEVDPKLSLKTPFYQSDFALESNPHSLAAAIFFFLLVSYAVLDVMFFNKETYAEQPWYQVYLLSGVGMAVLVMGWLSTAKVPKRESIIVALLVGGAFGAALHPGLLRFNQLTDTEGLTSYPYELQTDLSFEPPADKTLPRLYLGDEEFWSTFEFGSIHQFELRKGGLNFYQINLAPIEKLKAESEKTARLVPEATEPTSYLLPNKVLQTLTGHRSNVLSVTFSPDGQTVASGSKDKTIQLWEVSTGKRLQTLTGHRHKVQTVAFSPDGTLLASGSEDNTVKLWNIEPGNVRETLKGHQDSLLTLNQKVFSVAFSPDGETLASGNWDKSIMLWEVRSGNVLHVIHGRTTRFWGLVKDKGDGHTDSVNSVAFSPDGRILASGGFDKVIKLWDVKTGTLLKTLKGHGDFVLSVTFSPDGKTLASSSYDKSIKLWEVESGQVLQTLRGHQDAVTSVNFRPDGQIMVSGSFDRTVKLWEVNSGRLLSTLKGHKDYVNTVVFSPDGRLIASASGDDTVKLWGES